MVLVRWFCHVGDAPDEVTGMWMVKPGMDVNSPPEISIIHVDSIMQAAHLEPVYGSDFVPLVLQYHHSLDVFKSTYVNKFADHHSFDIAF